MWGSRQLKSTHSCLSGLRREHGSGASHSLKEWPPGPLPHPNTEGFSCDSGETLLMGQSKISQGRQASVVPIVGRGPPFITQEQVSAFSTLPFALSCLSLPLLCWPLKGLACLGILVSSNNSAFESLCDSKMENRCLP